MMHAAVRLRKEEKTQIRFSFYFNIDVDKVLEKFSGVQTLVSLLANQTST